MLVKRYSFIIANRSTGVVHRFALSFRPKLVVALLFALPSGGPAMPSGSMGPGSTPLSG